VPTNPRIALCVVYLYSHCLHENLAYTRPWPSDSFVNGILVNMRTLMDSEW